MYKSFVLYCSVVHSNLCLAMPAMPDCVGHVLPCQLCLAVLAIQLLLMGILFKYKWSLTVVFIV